MGEIQEGNSISVRHPRGEHEHTHKHLITIVMKGTVKITEILIY